MISSNINLKISSSYSRPDRLRPIAERFNLDQVAVLDNVLYARAYTSEHQYELLDYVAAKFHEEAGVFKLLIIDSSMALFRVDYRYSIEHFKNYVYEL